MQPPAAGSSKAYDAPGSAMAPYAKRRAYSSNHLNQAIHACSFSVRGLLGAIQNPQPAESWRTELRMGWGSRASPPTQPLAPCARSLARLQRCSNYCGSAQDFIKGEKWEQPPLRSTGGVHAGDAGANGFKKEKEKQAPPPA